MNKNQHNQNRTTASTYTHVQRNSRTIRYSAGRGSVSNDRCDQPGRSYTAKHNARHRDPWLLLVFANCTRTKHRVHSRCNGRERGQRWCGTNAYSTRRLTRGDRGTFGTTDHGRQSFVHAVTPTHITFAFFPVAQSHHIRSFQRQRRVSSTQTQKSQESRRRCGSSIIISHYSGKWSLLRFSLFISIDICGTLQVHTETHKDALGTRDEIETKKQKKIIASIRQD